MNGSQQNVDRVVQLLPDEGLRQVHALLHVTAGLEPRLAVGRDVRQDPIKDITMVKPVYLEIRASQVSK